MRLTETFNYAVRLYIGNREGYHGPEFSRNRLVKSIAAFQTTQKQLFSLKIMSCLYMVGEWSEEGWEVEAINHPEHPAKLEELEEFIRGLTRHLLRELRQEQITVTGYWKTWTFKTDESEHGTNLPNRSGGEHQVWGLSPEHGNGPVAVG